MLGMKGIELTLKELKAVLEITDDEKASNLLMDKAKVILRIDDGQAEYLSGIIKDKLVCTGFNSHYSLNRRGVEWQDILDKFIEAGW